MCDLLKFESDMMTIQVIENSRNYSQLVSARGREAERKKYISRVGYLYPDRSDRLGNVQDFKSLWQLSRQVLTKRCSSKFRPTTMAATRQKTTVSQLVSTKY